MPRSDSGQQARVEARLEAFWQKLEWWYSGRTGERESQFTKVSFFPIPLAEELGRRDVLSSMCRFMRFDEFYAWEIENQAWQEEFDELYGNYFEGDQRRIDALFKNFISPFPRVPLPKGSDSRNPLADSDGWTARGCFVMACAVGVGCCDELGQWRPSTSADRFEGRFRRYLRSCFPEDRKYKIWGRRGGSPGGFSGNRPDKGVALYWSPGCVVRFKPFVESQKVRLPGAPRTCLFQHHLRLR